MKNNINYFNNLKRCWIHDTECNINENKNISDHPYIIDSYSTTISLNTNHCFYNIQDKLKHKIQFKDLQMYCSNKNTKIKNSILDIINKHPSYFMLLQECSDELLIELNDLLKTELNSHSLTWVCRPINYINVQSTEINSSLINKDNKGQCTSRHFNNYNVTIYNNLIYTLIEENRNYSKFPAGIAAGIAAGNSAGNAAGNSAGIAAANPAGNEDNYESNTDKTKISTIGISSNGNKVKFHNISKSCQTKLKPCIGSRGNKIFIRHQLTKFIKNDNKQLYIVFNVHYSQNFRESKSICNFNLEFDYLGTCNDGILKTLINEFNKDLQIIPYIIIGGDFNKKLCSEYEYNTIFNKVENLKKYFLQTISYPRFLQMIQLYKGLKYQNNYTNFNIGNCEIKRLCDHYDQIFLFQSSETIPSKLINDFSLILTNVQIIYFFIFNIKNNFLDMLESILVSAIENINIVSFINFIFKDISKLCVSKELIDSMLYIIHILIICKTQIINDSYPCHNKQEQLNKALNNINYLLYNIIDIMNEDNLFIKKIYLVFPSNLEVMKLRKIQTDISKEITKDILTKKIQFISDFLNSEMNKVDNTPFIKAYINPKNNIVDFLSNIMINFNKINTDDSQDSDALEEKSDIPQVIYERLIKRRKRKTKKPVPKPVQKPKYTKHLLILSEYEKILKLIENFNISSSLDIDSFKKDLHTYTYNPKDIKKKIDEYLKPVNENNYYFQENYYKNELIASNNKINKVKLKTSIILENNLLINLLNCFSKLNNSFDSEWNKLPILYHQFLELHINNKIIALEHLLKLEELEDKLKIKILNKETLEKFKDKLIKENSDRGIIESVNKKIKLLENDIKEHENKIKEHYVNILSKSSGTKLDKNSLKNTIATDIISMIHSYMNNILSICIGILITFYDYFIIINNSEYKDHILNIMKEKDLSKLFHLLKDTFSNNKFIKIFIMLLSYLKNNINILFLVKFDNLKLQILPSSHVLVVPREVNMPSPLLVSKEEGIQKPLQGITVPLLIPKEDTDSCVLKDPEEDLNSFVPEELNSHDYFIFSFLNFLDETKKQNNSLTFEYVISTIIESLSTDIETKFNSNELHGLKKPDDEFYKEFTNIKIEIERVFNNHNILINFIKNTHLLFFMIGKLKFFYEDFDEIQNISTLDIIYRDLLSNNDEIDVVVINKFIKSKNGLNIIVENFLIIYSQFILYIWNLVIILHHYDFFDIILENIGQTKNFTCSEYLQFWPNIINYIILLYRKNEDLLIEFNLSNFQNIINYHLNYDNNLINNKILKIYEDILEIYYLYISKSLHPLTNSPDCQKKYLKYKHKYLMLKNKLIKENLSLI